MRWRSGRVVGADEEDGGRGWGGQLVLDEGNEERGREQGYDGGGGRGTKAGLVVVVAGEGGGRAGGERGSGGAGTVGW